jgi:hypothetical protein
MNYYDKYQKYKKKYMYLKNSKYDFYLVHDTRFENLELILKSGKIKLGKNVPEEKRKYCGDHPSDYIFTSIFFEDIKNLSHLGDFNLILHPKIVFEQKNTFNKGWEGGPSNNGISLSKKDSHEITNKKLEEIRKFLKNPTLPEKLKNFNSFLHHEVVFEEPIDIYGNLLAIECNSCDEKVINKLKSIMKEHKYDVPIYTKNFPLPKLQDLLNYQLEHKFK